MKFFLHLLPLALLITPLVGLAQTYGIKDFGAVADNQTLNTAAIQRAIDAHGLPGTAIRFGPRSGQWYGPEPRTSTEALALAVANADLTRLIRIWLANRGIWEALPGAGPNVPLPSTSDDIQHYVTAYDELLDALTT